MSSSESLNSASPAGAQLRSTTSTATKPRWTAPLPEVFSVSKDPKAIKKIQEYLGYWGHLDAEKDLTEGLKKFQQHARIPVTGVYDAVTAAQMEQSPCGNRIGTGLGCYQLEEPGIMSTLPTDGRVSGHHFLKQINKMPSKQLSIHGVKPALNSFS